MPAEKERKALEELLEEELPHLPATGDQLRFQGHCRAAELQSARRNALARKAVLRAARDGEEAATTRRLTDDFRRERQRHRALRQRIGRDELLLGEVPDAHSAVLGRIVDPHGEPIAGAEVVVSDGTWKRFPAVESDDQGRYLASMPIPEFRKRFEGSRELVLGVKKESEKLFHRARQPFGDPAKRVRVFDVSIPAEAFGALEETRARLSELEGIGPKRQELLRRAGIESPSDLVAAGVEGLTKIDGVSEVRASKWIEAARELLGSTD